MDSINIIEEKENKVLKRKEIKAEINAQKVPNREEISELIAKKFSVEKQAVVIENINGKFGSSVFLIYAKIYSSIQDKEKIEPKSKKDKKEAESKKEGAE
jgi:ribosomal protein S24E